MGRWLGLVDETTFGTPVSPPTTFLDCISIGLHPEREPMKVPSMASLGAQSGKVGSYKIVGDIEMHPSSENVALLLKWLLGTPTTTQDDANPRYMHEFLPSDVLKFGTCYKADDVQPDGTNSLQYTSVIPLSIRVEAALNAAVSVTFGMFGQKDAKIATPSVGTFSAIEQFYSLLSKVYWDLSQSSEIVNVDSISFTYTRAISEDFYSMNDAFLKGFIPGEATLEGTMDLIFDSWDAYEKFWGATTAPVQDPALAILDVDFIGPSLGGTGDYANHRMRWQLPAVQLHGIDDPYARRDKIMQSVTLSGVRGTVGSDVCLAKVTLANTMSVV